MSSPERPVSHLLWCMLIALRTDEHKRPPRPETARRRFLDNWLKTARRTPAFRSMDDEITALQALIASERNHPVDALLHTLHMQAEQADQCHLFRFRAAINQVMKAGWRTGVCLSPDLLIGEILLRCRGHHNHLLQLTKTGECFSVTGDMTAPVTFQLLTRKGDDDRVVSLAFEAERFQVAHSQSLSFNHRTDIHTLHIGIPALSPENWSPQQKVLH